MKKGLLLVATGVLSLSLAACSSNMTGTTEEKDAAKQAETTEQSAAETTSKTASDATMNKVFVIPNVYLNREGLSSEIDPASVEHTDVSDEQTKFTMSEKNMAEQSEKINSGIIGALTALAEGKTMESVKGVDTDDMYEHVKIFVDGDKFDKQKDPTVFGAIAISIATYQILEGWDEPKSKVDFVDNDTQKVLATKSIPDDVSKE